MDREDKLKAAKAQVVAKISDIIAQNFDQAGGALETPGTFTALLEAYRAIEIVLTNDSSSEHAQDTEDYRQGMMRNSDQQ
ncbi:hypothetical protein D3C80_1659510 [compost metagenome]